MSVTSLFHARLLWQSVSRVAGDGGRTACGRRAENAGDPAGGPRLGWRVAAGTDRGEGRTVAGVKAISRLQSALTAPAPVVVLQFTRAYLAPQAARFRHRAAPFGGILRPRPQDNRRGRSPGRP